MYLSKAIIYRQHHNTLFQSHRAYQRGMQSDLQILQSEIVTLKVELEAKRLEARQLAAKYVISNYPKTYIYLIEEIDRLVDEVFAKTKRLKCEQALIDE